MLTRARAALAPAQVNQHNYADHLDEHEAVFPYRSLPPGPMAEFLARPVQQAAQQEPRGRWRPEGFIEEAK